LVSSWQTGSNEPSFGPICSKYLLQHSVLQLSVLYPHAVGTFQIIYIQINFNSPHYLHVNNFIKISNSNRKDHEKSFFGEKIAKILFTNHMRKKRERMLSNWLCANLADKICSNKFWIAISAWGKQKLEICKS